MKQPDNNRFINKYNIKAFPNNVEENYTSVTVEMVGWKFKRKISIKFVFLLFHFKISRIYFHIWTQYLAILFFAHKLVYVLHPPPIDFVIVIIIYFRDWVLFNEVKCRSRLLDSIFITGVLLYFLLYTPKFFCSLCYHLAAYLNETSVWRYFHF